MMDRTLMLILLLSSNHHLSIFLNIFMCQILFDLADIATVIGNSGESLYTFFNWISTNLSPFLYDGWKWNSCFFHINDRSLAIKLFQIILFDDMMTKHKEIRYPKIHEWDTLHYDKF